MRTRALIVALAVSLPALGADTTSWVPYTSKDGNFIIDLPKKPTKTFTRTSRSPQGQVRIVIAQCDTPDVLYTAEKVELPKATGLKTQDVEAILDSQRDEIAAELNGKVITQKKLRLAGAPGRDFTIEGRPVEKGGLATIRVREFFGQTALYVLFASTAADRELPEDVGHFFASFTIGTTRVKKMGPHPEPAGKPLGSWGEAIDPDSDCKIADNGKVLEIEVPPTIHDLDADNDRFNAPRVVREVSGDFTITVKVAGEFKPGAKSTKPKGVPYNAAGIFVWQNSDNYIFLGRGALLRNNKVSAMAAFEEREWGSRGAVNNHGIDLGTVYLRIERRGNRILGATSKDGKTWTKLDPMEPSYPGTLKVGLYAINTSSDPLAVRFEDYSFTEGKGNASPRRR